MTGVLTKFSSGKTRLLACGLALLAMAACGSAPSTTTRSATKLQPVSIDGAKRFASGPIGSACTAQNNKNSTRQRCGCIQAAADLTLSDSEQRRGVRFFGDPELLQQMKLSDTPQNEKFWYTWARFAETAETLCKQT